MRVIDRGTMPGRGDSEVRVILAARKDLTVMDGSAFVI
jgi:hypothetical protein